jgi:hypothetical protein
MELDDLVPLDVGEHGVGTLPTASSSGGLLPSPPPPSMASVVASSAEDPSLPLSFPSWRPNPTINSAIWHLRNQVSSSLV